MKQISSLDLYYLLKEFKFLEENRIDNFYFENDIFFIKMYVKGKGHFYLENSISNYIFITDKKEEISNFPNSFIQHLRKYLKNGYLKKIEQVENERILKLRIETKDSQTQIITPYYLIIELFANGNVILCDENLLIKNSIVKKKYKDRVVMVKEEYVLPPQKQLNIFNLNLELFKEELKKSDLSIVKFIAIKFGLGGKFAEEICENSKIDKNKLTQDIDETNLKNLENELKNIPNLDIKPKLVMKGEKIIDFIPFEFKSIKDEQTHIDTFNNAIKTYFEQFRDNVDIREDEFTKELAKLKKRLEKQIESKQEVLKDYEIYNGYGNKIYENYALIEDLLNSINTSAKNKGWDSVLKTIKENEKLSKIVKSLNYKNNEIELELQ